MNNYNYCGINKNTYDLIIKDGVINDASEYGSRENLVIVRMLEEYTKNVNKPFIYKILFSRLAFNSFSYDKDSNTHTLDIGKDNSISFKLLSEIIEDIPRSLKKNLESDERKRKCHLDSMAILHSSDNFNLITGLVKLGKYHFLHSVIEMVKGEKKFILDSTMNIYMEESQYFELLSFQFLNKITDDILNDKDLIINFGLDDFSTKLFLVFRDEIIKDLSKNLFLLGNDKVRKRD